MLYDSPATGTISVQTSNLTHTTFDELVQQFREVTFETGQGIRVDCSELVFVDPFAMIGIILLSRQYAREFGVPLTFALPEGDVRSYLGRAGFFKQALSFAKFEPDIPEAWLDLMDAYQGSNPVLLEVTPLSEEAVIASILDRVEKVLQRRLRYKKYDAYDICIILSEICHNIFDHNPNAATGYAAMQLYKRQRPNGGFLEIAVGDDGVGVRASLRRNPKYEHLADDTEAIIKGLDNHVSEYNDITRGNGLFHLWNLVLKHRGSLCIRSGEGKVYLRGDKSRAHARHVGALDGVQFAITLPSQTTHQQI
jgi:anti-sigma regulatory factor (Ser/Thr protein kinase)